VSICLSCGFQRDSCEICGGDLDDAHMASTLRSRLAAAEKERDEAQFFANVRHADEYLHIVAENRLLREFFLNRPHYGNAALTDDLLPLTAAEVERVKALEAQNATLREALAEVMKVADRFSPPFMPYLPVDWTVRTRDLLKEGE
jgi:hypothetical protein